MGKILVIVSGGILVLAMITGVVMYATEKTASVKEVRVTNVTGTSATVTWVTEEAVRGSVIYSEKDKWVPVMENIGKKRAYDDRDTEEVEYGEYELKKWGEYYVHHVTLRGLEPNSKYYYRISTGMKTVDEKTYYSEIETGEVIDEIRSPDPMYGMIKDENQEELERDAIIYLTVYFENGETGYTEESAKYSVVSRDGSYSFDMVNVRSKFLDEMFVKEGEKYYENIEVAANGYNKGYLQVDSEEDQPASTLLIAKEQEETESLRRWIMEEVEAEETANLNCNHPNDTGVELGRWEECCACNKKKTVVKCEGKDGYDQFHWSPCTIETVECQDMCPAQTDPGGGVTCASGSCGNPGGTIDWCESRYCDGNGNLVCREKYCDADGCIQTKAGRYDTCTYGCENGACKEGSGEDTSGGSGGTCANEASAPYQYMCKGSSCGQFDADCNWNEKSWDEVPEGECAACRPSGGGGEEDEVQPVAPEQEQEEEIVDGDVCEGICSDGEGTLHCIKDINKWKKLNFQIGQYFIDKEENDNDFCVHFLAEQETSDCSTVCICWKYWRCDEEDKDSKCDSLCEAYVSEEDETTIDQAYCDTLSCPWNDLWGGPYYKNDSCYCVKNNVYEYDDACYRNIIEWDDNSNKWITGDYGFETTECPDGTCATDGNWGVKCESDSVEENGQCKCDRTSIGFDDLGVPEEAIGMNCGDNNEYTVNGMKFEISCNGTDNADSSKNCWIVSRIDTDEIEVPVEQNDTDYRVMEEEAMGSEAINICMGRFSGSTTKCTGNIPDRIETYEGDCYLYRKHHRFASGYIPTCWATCVDATGGVPYRAEKIHDGECVSSLSSNIEQNKLINKVHAEESGGEVNIQESGVYEVQGATVTTGSNEITLVVNEELGELKVRFFNDENSNGIKDEGEEYIDSSGVTLSKKQDVTSYDFKQGWNLYSFPIVSDDITTADGLLESISDSGGYATHVAAYEGGRWKVYSKRGEVSFSNDFNILPGVGYFIKVYQEAEMRIEGNRFEESLQLDLEVGWNLVGVISPDNEYTADSLIDGIVGSGIGADTVTRWESGRYDNYIKEENISYGNDFKIFEVGGYFVRVKEDGGKFTP